MLLLLLGCATTTGGERVELHAEVVGAAPIVEVDGAPAIQWTDSTGWTITLSEARLWAGPIYLWSEEPRLDPGGLGLLRRVRDVILPTAYAFDQLQAGFLVGEVTAQVEVDLLGGPVELPDGSGLAGPSRSAELWLEPAPSGDTLSVRGTATREDLVVPFSAAMTVDDDWVGQPDDNPVLLRRMRGLLWQAELAEGGTLTLGVDPRRWLDGADFSVLLGGTVDDRGDHAVQPHDAVGRILYARSRRIGATGPWTFSWTPPE